MPTIRSQRAGSEGLEVIARDRQHAEPLAPSVPDEVVPGLGVVVEGRDHFKRRRVIAKKREVRAGEVVPRGGLVGFLLVQANELPRLLVRQWSEDDGLEHAEDRRCGADPHGKRGDHNGGEAGTASKLSTGVAQILQDVLDARPTPRRARVLGDACQIPEVATRSLPSGFGWFTRLDALLRIHGQVGDEFALKILLQLPPAEKRLHTSNQSLHDVVTLRSAASRGRWP